MLISFVATLGLCFFGASILEPPQSGLEPSHPSTCCRGQCQLEDLILRVSSLAKPVEIFVTHCPRTLVDLLHQLAQIESAWLHSRYLPCSPCPLKHSSEQCRIALS